MINQLVRLGFRIFATEGTAAMIERNGMPVQLVPRRIGRGKPDILDVILNGRVDAVINTPGPADKEILDGLEIRRAAVERGIPCITSIDTARAMIGAMSKRTAEYSVQPFPTYRKSGFGY
jgi:carbamoyl-phosphate synthase large subunit